MDRDERIENLYGQLKAADADVAAKAAAYEAAVAHRANRLLVLNGAGESYAKIGARIGRSAQRIAQIVAREAKSA